MNAQKQNISFNPSDLTNDQIDRIAFAIIGRIEALSINGIEKPLTREKAAEHIGLGVDYIDKLRRNRHIEPHYFPDSNVPFYFASEINEALKGINRRKKT